MQPCMQSATAHQKIEKYLLETSEIVESHAYK